MFPTKKTLNRWSKQILEHFEVALFCSQLDYMLTFYLGSFLDFYFTDKQLLNYSHLRVDLPLPLKVKALHWSISICGNYLLKSLWWLCFFVDCDMIGSRLYSFSRWPPWNLYWFDFKLVRYIKKESTSLTFFRSNRN